MLTKQVWLTRNYGPFEDKRPTLRAGQHTAFIDEPKVYDNYGVPNGYLRVVQGGHEYALDNADVVELTTV